MTRTFETIDLAGDELHSAVEQAAGRELTPNEAYELVSAAGHFSFTTGQGLRGSDTYFAAVVTGDRCVYGPDPVTAQKRAYVLAHG